MTKVVTQPCQLNEFELQGAQLCVLGVQDGTLSLLLLGKVCCPVAAQVCDACSIYMCVPIAGDAQRMRCDKIAAKVYQQEA